VFDDDLERPQWSSPTDQTRLSFAWTNLTPPAFGPAYVGRAETIKLADRRRLARIVTPPATPAPNRMRSTFVQYEIPGRILMIHFRLSTDVLRLAVLALAAIPSIGWMTEPSAGPMTSVASGNTRVVWALHVSEAGEQLEVIRTEWTSNPPRGETWRYALTISTDGELADSVISLHAMQDVTSQMALSRERLRAKEAIQLRTIGVDPSSVRRRFSAPDGSLEVLTLSNSAVLLDHRPSANHPVALPLTIRDAIFPPGASRFVAVTDRDELAIVEDNGTVLYKTAPSWLGETIPSALGGAFGIDQICAHPGGAFVTYVLQFPPGLHETWLLDLSRLTSMQLNEMPDGTAYYSPDGARMVLISRRAPPGEALLYDTSDPRIPRLLNRYATEASIFTAAVSDDRTLIAMQQLDEESTHRYRVLLFDDTLQQLGAPLLTDSDALGLRFVGRFLLVGTQEAPIPTYSHTKSTTDVVMFDLAP